MLHCLTRLAATSALALPLLAAAHGRTDPADPDAPARPLAHRSAFADYKPYQDIVPGDWRRLNDTVGRAALKPGAAGAVSGAPSAPSAPSAPAAPAASSPRPRAVQPHAPATGPGHAPHAPTHTHGGRP